MILGESYASNWLSNLTKNFGGAHQVDPAVAAQVVDLASSTYFGFNQQHLTEMLAEHEGIGLSRSSVRRILSDAMGEGGRLQR